MAQYAEIVEIVAPAEAVTDSQVNVTVKIKNITSIPIIIRVYGTLLYGGETWLGIEFPFDRSWALAGQTYSFDGYFTMPDKKVTIYAYSYWSTDGSFWYLDDEKTKEVKLAELAPAFSEFKITDYVKV